MIPTGPYDLISIDSIVAAAKMVCDFKDTTDCDAELEYYVNDGARWMSTQETFIKKTSPVDIEEGKAKLPKGFHSFIGLRPIFDSSVAVDPTVDYTQSCSIDQWYYDKNFINQCDTRGYDGGQNLSNTFEINGGYIVFTFPLPANFTKCLIAYKGMATDEKTGLMLLPADYERPLRAYAAWQLMLSHPSLWPVSFQPYYSMRLKSLEKEYKETRAAIQSNSDLRQWNNTKYQFKRIYHALLQNQNTHA